MAYQALYRKWRPLTFDDVIGQSHIVNTLKNEIIEGKTAHAYIFTGTRGTGKTSTAKILSRAVNCENPHDGNPCNECDTCKSILDGSVLDIIEIDAASNTGVDNIREIIEQCRYASASTKYKVYIIDEVHMLSAGAFNALLKTLEEPPSHVIFILATTEIHMVPATILSRCQRFDFGTISINDIVSAMKRILASEGISVDDDALEYVAYLGNGSMRDSLSILDRCIAFKNGAVSYSDVVDILGTLDNAYLYKFASLVADNDTKNLLLEFDKCAAEGKSFENFAADMLNAYREMLRYLSIGSNEGTNAKRLEMIRNTAEKFTKEKLVRCIYLLTDLISDLRYSTNARVLIECTLIKMANPMFSEDVSSLLDRISTLEKKIASGLIAAPTAAQPEQNQSVSSDNPLAESDDYLPEPPPDGDYYEPPSPQSPGDDRPSGDGNAVSAQAGTSAADDGICGKIVNNWSEIINRIQQEKMIVMYMHILTAKPTCTLDGITLVFEDREKKKDFEKSKDSDKLEKIIRECFGECPKISCAVYGETIADIVQDEEQNKNADGDIFINLAKQSDEYPENIKLD